MDLMSGGDFRFHHSKIRKFSHNKTKFFIACLIQALEATHEQGIIHRDIKPENLVFDSRGYMRLTDFGIAREWTAENSTENSGTPGYMAPEVMFKQNHGIAADYFAVGVIGYECVMGRRPYLGRSRKEIRDAVLNRQACIKERDMPPGYTKEAIDFINGCLIRQPAKRLGVGGTKEIKSHPWFADFDWPGLIAKTIEPEFVPDQTQVNFDDNHVNHKAWNDQDEIAEHTEMLRRESQRVVFENYYFDKDKMKKNDNYEASLATEMADEAEAA